MKSFDEWMEDGGGVPKEERRDFAEAIEAGNELFQAIPFEKDNGDGLVYNREAVLENCRCVMTPVVDSKETPEITFKPPDSWDAAKVIMERLGVPNRQLGKRALAEAVERLHRIREEIVTPEEVQRMRLGDWNIYEENDEEPEGDFHKLECDPTGAPRLDSDEEIKVALTPRRRNWGR